MTLCHQAQTRDYASRRTTVAPDCIRKCTSGVVQSLANGELPRAAPPALGSEAAAAQFEAQRKARSGAAQDIPHIWLVGDTRGYKVREGEY